ncbi:MAG: sigma-54-dependent transcriptional regulator [Gammaproteobacteria bacterium]
MDQKSTETRAGEQAKLLVVDDDQDMLCLLESWLRKGDYDVQTVSSGAEALAQIEVNRPDLVLTDLFMEEMDGMTLLRRIHDSNPLMPVIMLSGQAAIPDAVKATHLGTSAFLTKPVDKEILLGEISKHISLFARNRSSSSFSQSIVHKSARMAEVLEQAELVAAGDITVFISGETGTGKEVLAKAIHAASARREAPFIGVNCGAIPEQLLESELFGHEKGAFTGANSKHDGLFKAADGGTIFLDEIGDMPLGLQVKLLRVLQDFEIRPVGSTTNIPVNARILSATHNNLEKLVAQGDFREDLYYRLNVVPLEMPALRERREDIPLLLNHFLALQASKTGKNLKHFEGAALEYLAMANWPGNVRQLANVVELCTILSKGDEIPLTLAQRALREEPGQLQTLKEAKHDTERKYLISVLRMTEGNVANAARIAGRNRTEFYKLLTTHGLDAADFRP